MSERRPVGRRARRVVVRAVACLALLAAVAAPAQARISDAATIDGPSSAIVDLGGVDMADDGGGGIVYRKRVDGHVHIFAARLTNGVWGPPQRVDVGQQFDSSWPQIAAGEDGRLLVTWVQEFGVGIDRMFSSLLGPGATRFQAPIPVDFNVGESIATFPSLAMNATGIAYLAYRVVYATSQTNATLPPGTVDADVRVARTTGALWNVIGQPIDRNPIQPVATPTAANSPRIGVDRNGNALVAWQEPDDLQIDRIWARRVFGLSIGNPLEVSPAKLGAAGLQSGADAFSLAVAGFGEGAVAMRQLPDPAAGLLDARIFTNTIPESFSDHSGAFAGARVADGAADPGPTPPLGVPSVGVTPRGDLRTTFGSGLSSIVAGGDDTGAGAAARLDDGTSSVAGDPVTQLGTDGAAVTAWKVLRGGLGGVVVQERRADGVVTNDQVAAPEGGVVSDLRSAGSGLGDAAIGFLQGSGAGAQIAAAVVDAPPQQFAVQAPLDFVSTAKIPITWDDAEHAIGSVTYDVAVDDQQVASDRKVARATLDAAAIGDGVHTIVVTATDSAGQPTESTPAQVSIDRTRPKISVRRHGRALTVSVTDGRKSETSGVKTSATRISFGDGKHVSGRGKGVRHRYSRAGSYHLTIVTSDRAGNHRTLRRTMRIR